MIKRILYFTIITLLVGVASYFSHFYYLESSSTSISFSLAAVYTFFCLTAIVTYLLIEIAAKYVADQAGFGYLVTIFIKMGLFILLFKPIIFSEKQLQMPTKISLIIPLFLFLLIEVIGIGKLLNNK